MTARGAEPGAIHDIGYRRYTGERLGPAAIGRSLFGHSLRGAFGLGRSTKSKVVPLLLLGLMTAPAVIIAAVAIIGRAGELPFAYTRYAVSFQLIITIFAAAQAPQSVSRDLRFRTIALYFSRPVSRRMYVVAKYLAMAAALFLLMAAPLLVLYSGALLAKMPVWDNTLGVLRGLAGTVLFAFVIAGIGLVVAAFTPRRGLGVAAVVAVLVLLGGVSAAVQGIAREEGQQELSGWAGLISPFSLVDGVQVWLLRSDTGTVTGPPGTTGGIVFAIAAVGVVLASYVLLLLRYRRVAVS